MAGERAEYFLAGISREGDGPQVAPRKLMISKTLLVTGGCGFIGSNYIRAELKANPDLRIVNLDALTYAGNLRNLASLEGNPHYHFHHGRIGDRALVGELLETHQVDAVVNFAAETHVDRSIDDPAVFVETNVLETTQLLQAIRNYFENLPAGRREDFRFLQISTDEVFGSLAPDGAPFCESSPFAPNSPYAASKAAADHLVRAYHRTYGLPVLTAHSSNNYGPFQLPEKLIPLVVTHALAGKPLPIYGDGSHVRDWLFVDDQVRSLAILLAQGRVGETYGVGGGAERDNLTVVKTICALLDRFQPKATGSYEDQITFVSDRPGHDSRYALETAKIRNELGWAPRETFSQGLEKTVRWYLESPEWTIPIGVKS